MGFGRRGGGAPQVVTQNTAPWGQQQGFLVSGFNEANRQKEIPRTFFPGQTYAGFDPAELEALQRGENRARNGSQSINMARDYARGILSGDPETLKSTLGPRVGELLPALQSQFNRAGMGASSLGRAAEQELVMRELSKLKESAADRLQELGRQEYEDIARLAGVGEVRRDMAQEAIDENMRRHEFEQMEPSERLARYLAMINGQYGQQGTEQRFPNRGSRASGLFGGALGGAAMGGMAGFNPLYGAVGGALSGLFG